MPIPFTCPHCGLQTSVADRYAGQTGPCAGCGQTITVPLVSGVSPGYSAPQKSSTGAMVAVIAVAVVGLLVCGGFLLLPFVMLGRGMPVATPAAQCPNNLKQLGLALHNYHDVYRCLPSAVLTDEDGQPMRSWRVAILPFVEQAPLYDQYDFSEPWDGPNNQALYGASIPTYRCPDDAGLGPSDASYVMIVGPGTIGGEPNETVRFANITDGTSNTIAAIEVGASNIHWMEPRDVTVDEAVTFLTDPAASPFQQVHPGGAYVLYTDGSVSFLADSTDPATVRALLTKDGGETVYRP